ncbi:hypothetical protein AC578_10427 [Pseudocercospora eumusae]|uniref:Ribonuclease P/MRP protein subunit POP5 n=1 Tax=Pseudocercospora eumusae TaxID=321146 RepID=A0A139HBD0_9PEZI|nr:hypothetical protein AC578_10427 [Pseudocercospora eumusae]
MVRIKHRYLLMNVLYPQDAPNAKHNDENVPWSVKFRRPSSDRFEAGFIVRMVRNGVAELFGDYGAGMVSGSLKVVYCSSATSTAIIRVARAHYSLVWAALSFVTKLPKPIDQHCVIQVVRVSGTIKKAEQEAIRRARLIILRASKATAHDDLDMLDNIIDGDGDGDEDVDVDENDEID